MLIDRSRRLRESQYFGDLSPLAPLGVGTAARPRGHGHSLVFARFDSAGARDIWTMNVADSSSARPLFRTPSDERSPVVSPDGQWVAYQSPESGRDEIHVRSLKGGGRFIVSVGGGRAPRWRGREIFYRKGIRIVAATVNPGAPSPAVSRRTVLEGEVNGFDVFPDGRLLVNQLVEQAPRIVMVLNWPTALERALTR